MAAMMKAPAVEPTLRIVASSELSTAVPEVRSRGEPGEVRSRGLLSGPG